MGEINKNYKGNVKKQDKYHSICEDWEKICWKFQENDIRGELEKRYNKMWKFRQLKIYQKHEY